MAKFNATEKNEYAAFQDRNTPRSLGAVYTEVPDNLPLDIEGYTNDRFSYDGEYVANHIRGFRWQIGITFDLLSDSE
jgi:hypothetical protein